MDYPKASHKSLVEIQHKVFCIFGDERVFNTKSPLLFSHILKKIGLNGSYVPFMVAPHQIGEAVHSMRTLNIAGANVTAPYKESVITHLDVLSEGANIVGAVNTITRNGDTLKGYNTNAVGFMNAMTETGFDAAGKTALVFGTGGAARAVVFILNWLRTETTLIAGRNEKNIQRIIDKIGGEPRPFEDLCQKSLNVDIIVNATPVSTVEDSAEMAKLLEGLDVRGCRLMIDLNYGRRNNLWERYARTKGIHYVDGLTTLTHQARRSFMLWTRIDIDARKFITALRNSFQSEERP
jgi:shikimate dehydrogenase